MPDPSYAKLVAAAPLAVGGLLILLNPLYDKLIERGAQNEFGGSRYLGAGKVHTPVVLITQYTSWALDVVQAGPLVIGPLVGLVAALGIGTIKAVVTWIYVAFVFIRFFIFVSIIVTKNPVIYGQKKIGFSRKGTLVFGWTRVSLIAMLLYIAAAVVAAILALVRT